MRCLLILALALGIGSRLAAQQPVLQLQGQPYFGGTMTLHVTAPADIGDPVLLAIGLDPLPLDAPLPMSKGPWYIGNFLSSFFIGTVAGNGRLDMAFTMPPVTPGAEGTAIALQAYVVPQLSNPATLQLDIPYLESPNAILLTSPTPQAKGEFGKYTAAGDLNGDGYVDVIIAAHKEDYLGVDMSGRVYILWGPDFSTSTTLSPPSPVVAGFFGIGLAIANLDNDAPDDLVVMETAGDPAPLGNPARVYVFKGGHSFSTSPAQTITSPGTGSEFSGYGAYHCIGDFDGDGWNDLALGHWRATVSGIPLAGRIDVFSGPSFGQLQSITAPQPVQGAGFGARVASADVNGDGIDDLIESSPLTPLAQLSGVGSAHVYLNPGFLLIETIQCPIPLGSSTRFGETIALADLNADAVPDLVAADAKNRLFIFWGAESENLTVLTKPPSAQANPFGDTAFGRHIAFGDVNGDSLIDLLVSDEFEGEEICPVASGGRVYVLLAPYFETMYRLADAFPHCSDSFGSSLLALQLDEDLQLEVTVGANFADDNGFFNSGHISTFGSQ
jgi:hypothetical protein